MRKAALAASAILGLMGSMTVNAASASETTVPGHESKESGTVMGVYDSVYAYDATGAYYLDLGDGRFQGVESIEDLDQESLTICDYKVVYQGDFGDDPYLDTGWVRNNVRCYGEEPGNFNYLIISEDDHRYTGERQAEWGTWEYLVNAEGGVGNLANPQHHVG